MKKGRRQDLTSQRVDGLLLDAHILILVDVLLLQVAEYCFGNTDETLHHF